MLDGNSHFRNTSGIVKFLSEIRKTPQIFVVGILNTDRVRDFTTPLQDSLSNKTSDGHTFPSRGGAGRFLNFLDSELKPLISNYYRTDDFSVISSHSLSGLFVIFSMLNKPDLFDAFIAASPNLWCNGEENMALAGEHFESSGHYEGKFYISYGGLDGAKIFPSCINFVKLLKTNTPSTFIFKADCLPDEELKSTPLLSIYSGLLFIFKDRDWAGSSRLNEYSYKF